MYEVSPIKPRIDVIGGELELKEPKATRFVDHKRYVNADMEDDKYELPPI